MATNIGSSEPTVSAWDAWRADLRHGFAHLWPRVARGWVPDLWTRLPACGGTTGSLALTFDDGPTDEGTPRLLDLLAAHEIRATFFLLGDQARRFPGRVREIVQAGHAVGNHFRHHVDCWSTPPRAVIREATEGARILEEVTGRRVKWLRPPYGRLTHAIVKWSRIHQQQIVLWDVFPPDYLPHHPVAALRRVLERRVRERSIVCLHDNPASLTRTPALLEETLPGLKARGWNFITLDDCSPSNTECAARRAA